MIVKKLITNQHFYCFLLLFVSLVNFKKRDMKKTVLFFFIGFCTLANICTAQTGSLAATADKTATAEVKPAIEEDKTLGMKETEYDFGKIPQGKPVVHNFSLVNNGTDSLKIENVQASCGCTTPEWEREKVQAPGEKTAITVGFNAASEGVFNKVITITYNGAKTKQITIKGEVWKTPVSSAPDNKDLNSLKD